MYVFIPWFDPDRRMHASSHPSGLELCLRETVDEAINTPRSHDRLIISTENRSRFSLTPYVAGTDCKTACARPGYYGTPIPFQFVPVNGRQAVTATALSRWTGSLKIDDASLVSSRVITVRTEVDFQSASGCSCGLSAERVADLHRDVISALDVMANVPQCCRPRPDCVNFRHQLVAGGA